VHSVPLPWNSPCQCTPPLGGTVQLTVQPLPLVAQATHGAISDAQILGANFPTQATISLGLTLWLERARFPTLGRLTTWEWTVVGGTTLVCNFGSNLLQQVCIRHVGAPQVLCGYPPLACLPVGWALPVAPCCLRC
jgi:hypothetical protein